MTSEVIEGFSAIGRRALPLVEAVARVVYAAAWCALLGVVIAGAVVAVLT